MLQGATAKYRGSRQPSLLILNLSYLTHITSHLILIVEERENANLHWF